MRMSLRDRIGTNLRRVREAAGMSQRDLASASGIAQSTIALAEVGERLPTVETLVQMARAMEVEAVELLREVGDE